MRERFEGGHERRGEAEADKGARADKHGIVLRAAEEERPRERERQHHDERDLAAKTVQHEAERKLRYAEGGEVHGRYKAERCRSERELFRNIRREHGIDAADEHSEEKRKAERYPESKEKRRKKSAAVIAVHIKPSPVQIKNIILAQTGDIIAHKSESGSIPEPLSP